MKSALTITLKNADRMSIGSLSELEQLVPEGMAGEALAYGQGEGQLRIGETVWGFYLVDAGNRSFALEEGVLSFEEAAAIATGIIHRARFLWGSHIESEVRGCHHDDITMRLIS
ncbi:hypothetical protein JIN84_06135 [Luteolibacter yonseiensis]|uniref:DUF3846 domain-containing protein n=1 Tax=Luteolibacter yonseiensis TaxID=1144680 RepID=A0A934V6M0_9BACT|nr:hypothetical protein [Luteolibacter yonseiensis]MBK1815182.1 hypothetical protein [Luteolibacter yonseiensis]